LKPIASQPLPTALHELTPRSIKASGWLLEQLRLQAEGLTGHLEELWPDVGPNSAWLGGTGEDWERGPYYLDGLVPLAYLLDDAELKAKAQKWIEAILASQQEDGFFGPPTNNDWWPRMVVLKVLTHYFEATGDERVIPFMTRYFRHQQGALPTRPLRDWGQARGAENILCVLWLFERTGEGWLLELASLLLGQTLDWDKYLTERLIQGPERTFNHFTHVVNVAMAIKYFAVQFLLDGDRTHLQTARAALANLDRYHGTAVGMFNGDEWLAGDSPSSGFELCAVVELMYSLEVLVRTFGEREFVDRLEQIAYNALPAHFDPRMHTHQYHQQVNQVLCTVARRNWTMSSDDTNTFGLEPHFGCCTANLHQGWPKFVRSLWMETADGGLAAVAYAPNRVRTVLGGIPVSLELQTEYPFKERVRLEVNPAQAVQFPLHLRIPQWCEAAQLSVNGEAVNAVPNEHGFVRVERTWQAGDALDLYLPMKLRRLERPYHAVALALGPLTLAFWPGEIWEQIPGSEGFGDWEVRPRHSWNFGLALDSGKLEECVVERFELRSPPFSLGKTRQHGQVEGAPLRVRVPAQMVEVWDLEQNSAARPPQSPVYSRLPVHTVHFVPYACTRIRVAEVPITTAHREMQG